MIHSILDACEFILETQGGPETPCGLSALMDEMRLWKASEQKVRAALDGDIAKGGGESRFVKMADDEYALRPRTTGT